MKFAIRGRDTCAEVTIQAVSHGEAGGGQTANGNSRLECLYLRVEIVGVVHLACCLENATKHRLGVCGSGPIFRMQLR